MKVKLNKHSYNRVNLHQGLIEETKPLQNQQGNKIHYSISGIPALALKSTKHLPMCRE